MNKKYLLLALATALIGLSSCTPSARTGGSAVAQESFANAATDVNTPAFADVLAKYVNETGLVDYDTLQENRDQLDAYNSSLQL